MLEAVQHDGFALRCASRALRRDLEVCLAAVAQAGGALEFVDDSLRTNCRLVRCATAQDPRSIVFATTPASEAALRMAARERPSAACKCGILRRSLLHVARNVLSDKEAMLPVLRHHGNHLKHCAAHLRAGTCSAGISRSSYIPRYFFVFIIVFLRTLDVLFVVNNTSKCSNNSSRSWCSNINAFCVFVVCLPAQTAKYASWPSLKTATPSDTVRKHCEATVFWSSLLLRATGST